MSHTRLNASMTSSDLANFIRERCHQKSKTKRIVISASVSIFALLEIGYTAFMIYNHKRLAAESDELVQQRNNLQNALIDLLKGTRGTGSAKSCFSLYGQIPYCLPNSSAFPIGNCVPVSENWCEFKPPASQIDENCENVLKQFCDQIRILNNQIGNDAIFGGSIAAIVTFSFFALLTLYYLHAAFTYVDTSKPLSKLFDTDEIQTIEAICEKNAIVLNGANERAEEVLQRLKDPGKQERVHLML